MRAGRVLCGGVLSSGPVGANYFVTTHWSVVLRAGQRSDPAAEQALGELCQSYWRPLYVFARSLGNSPHDAQDLTQAFFAHLLKNAFVERASRAKGRFRNYLLTSFKHFAANEWDRQHALKRGGFEKVISLDQAVAESAFKDQPVHGLTPDVLYERQWATTLLERVLGQLESEYAASRRTDLFKALQPCLARDAAAPYAAIAARLRISEPAVKMAVRRLRARYRELLREEIARTVASAEEVEDELRHLFATFGS